MRARSLSKAKAQPNPKGCAALEEVVACKAFRRGGGIQSRERHKGIKSVLIAVRR
jgi:hypothetical protein